MLLRPRLTHSHVQYVPILLHCYGPSRTVYGSHAPYKPSAILTVCILKQVRFKCITARSISHKPQEARFKCKNIPCSISHIPKQARFKCDISRSISHIPNQTRFKCSIPRSISHKPQKARFKCNIPLSVSRKLFEGCFKYNNPRFISHKPKQKKTNIIITINEAKTSTPHRQRSLL